MNALTEVEAAAPVRPRLPKALVAAGAAVLIGAGGAAWIAAPSSTETTDNAYVRADSTTVSARIRGTVVQLFVHDNQQVRAGDPLLRIDPEEYGARLASARAGVADAQAAEASARAALAAFEADRRVAAADVGVARTAIASAEAERSRADADNRRYVALAEDGFVSKRDAERIAATAVDARSQLDHSRASLLATRERAAATDSRRAALQADLGKAIAATARSRADLALAEQDQSYTLVRAPVTGTVGNRQARIGDLVQPGTQMLTVVPRSGLYVLANFKETQTARMVVGQRATIRVDALGGRALTGHVESFSPSSASEFALLPFEPGSGNFTKIVQRVPVRIALDDGQSTASPLRSGLSVTAKVRVTP